MYNSEVVVNGHSKVNSVKDEGHEKNGELQNDVKNSNQENQVVDQPPIRTLGPYQKLLKSLSKDPVVQKELTLGKRIGFYRIGHELGIGNFSKVKLGTHTLTRDVVAIKILEKSKLDQKAQRLLSQEIANMQLICHPNIIMMYEVIDSISQVFLVLECAGGGDLYHKIADGGPLEESQARSYYQQVLDAIEYLHGHCIIHRDIKAENIYLTTDGRNIKLGDLGFSIKVASMSQKLTTFCGSPPYAAPELFRDENYEGCYVDIWALGVLLYFLVLGSTPFKGETIAEVKKKILLHDYKFPANRLSKDCEGLIDDILQMDPKGRLSIFEMRTSPWFLKDSNIDSQPVQVKYSVSYLQTSNKKSPMYLNPSDIINLDGRETPLMFHKKRDSITLLDEIPETVKEAVLAMLIQRYGVNYEEAVEVLSNDNIRHPLMGMYRLNLHLSLKGQRRPSRQKRVTIRQPTVSYIGTSDSSQPSSKKRNKFSHMCAIL